MFSGRGNSVGMLIGLAKEFVSYNRYNYCKGNPLKYTDPSGEEWIWVSDHRTGALNLYQDYLQWEGEYPDDANSAEYGTYTDDGVFSSGSPGIGAMRGTWLNTIKGWQNTAGWGGGHPGGSYLARQSTRRSSSGIIAGALPEKPSIRTNDIRVIERWKML